MNEMVDPFHAQWVVDQLERRIAPTARAAPAPADAAALLADAPDGVPSVPGVPEPPD